MDVKVARVLRPQASFSQIHALLVRVLRPLHRQHRRFKRLHVSYTQPLKLLRIPDPLFLYREMVNLPFHQVVRATTPVFTVCVYHLAFSYTYSYATFLSLIPVIVGVILMTYGDYSWTKPGLLLTLFGAFLAALKTVTTNHMQTSGHHLSALELLYRMPPLAFLQSLTLSLYYQNEFEGLLPLFVNASTTIKIIMLFTVNGALAFTLNYTSFTANKKAGALTMTVAANVKQILTVLLAVIFWGLEVGYINSVGIFVTLAGGVWYGMVEIRSKKRFLPLWKWRV